MDSNILALTALKQTWGSNENIVFLGEWCKKYDEQHYWDNRIHKTVPFHWDDREKFKKDYDYLESLHKALLNDLCKFLNAHHQVNYSIRYWQLIVDPWLLSYVGITFDRWECIRMAYELYPGIKVLFLEANQVSSKYISWSDFMLRVIDDSWNQLIFQRIIESDYKDKFEIIRTNQQIEIDSTETSNTTLLQRIFSLRKLDIFLLRKIDTVIGKLSNRSKVVFAGSYFGIGALTRLNLSLSQLPRLYIREFDLYEKSIPNLLKLVRNVVKPKNEFSFHHSSAFELFIKKWIIEDLPSSILEAYPLLQKRAAAITMNPEIIVTANYHWGNIIAKFWFASQILKGTKLVILEHGGSFPAFKELFDFEEDIADIRGSWFLPYHQKHIQVPPSKLVTYKNFIFRSNITKKDGYLFLIGSEHPRYVYRAHFYPMSHQCLLSMNLIVALYQNLDAKIKTAVKLKPYPNQGWNTKARYSEKIGADKILPIQNLSIAMKNARMIVCSYPETTFSEAMTTGIPTILIYPEKVYERNEIAYHLIERLKKAKILFHDPVAASMHINEVWENINMWWESSTVIGARKKYYTEALNLEDDWLSKWNCFLEKIGEVK